MEATGREAEGSEDEVWPKLLGISCTASATQSPPGWNHLQQLGLGVFRICLVHWGSDDSYCSKEEVRPFGIFPHTLLRAPFNNIDIVTKLVFLSKNLPSTILIVINMIMIKMMIMIKIMIMMIIKGSK